MIDTVVWETIKFLMTTVPIIVVISYLVSYSISKGILDMIINLLSPFLKKLNLNQILTTSIALSFISPIASYTMLSQMLREGKVNEKEIIAASLINSFPSTLSHVYSFFIPFVIPVLGWVGLVYTSLRLVVAFIKSIIGYFIASKVGVYRVEGIMSNQTVDPLKSTWDTVKRVVPIMTITCLIVNTLLAYDAFNKISLESLPLNPYVITIAMVEIINFRAAVILSANILENELLSPKWVLIGLMLGNVISFSTRFVRHSLPLHLSLFGKLGIKIVIINAILTLILDIIIIIFITFLL
ncbi:MAG TPA: nucleoside recognition protein [Archaeoglobus profundus]|nr:nucleoside recognition protein [Archaeoglobus profundus]